MGLGKGHSKGSRNLAYLKETVEKIYKAIRLTELAVEARYDIESILPKQITFIHTEELVERYPDLTPKERENAITKEYGAVFLIGIGGVLSDGKPHDGRAPDYDDWTTETENGYKGLNGDILVWNDNLGAAFELSSMGIRVDEDTLKRQVAITGDQDRLELEWHRALLNGLFPLTIGGGDRVNRGWLCSCFVSNISEKSKPASGRRKFANNMKISYKIVESKATKEIEPCM